MLKTKKIFWLSAILSVVLLTVVSAASAGNDCGKNCSTNNECKNIKDCTTCWAPNSQTQKECCGCKGVWYPDRTTASCSGKDHAACISNAGGHCEIKNALEFGVEGICGKADNNYPMPTDPNDDGSPRNSWDDVRNNCENATNSSGDKVCVWRKACSWDCE